MYHQIMNYLLHFQDTDGDQRVSFDDYTKAVHNDDLLLECLGQCLPIYDVGFFALKITQMKHLLLTKRISHSDMVCPHAHFS